MAMKLHFLLGLALLLGVNGAGPITKVITLLKDMAKELDAEAKEDENMYEKLKCWCDTNKGGKSQAVQDQKDKIDELNSLIEGSAGKKAELATEIGQLKKDIAESTQALKEATEIRTKEAAEFHTQEMGFYDVIPKLALGNATQVNSLEECLSMSHFVTLHVPRLASTTNLIDAKAIAHMKKGSFLINASRGEVVDINAFADGVKSGHLAGGAADVFPKEPKANGEGVFECPLLGLKNVLLTPHTGGSTEEAQEAIGVEVSNAMIKFINTGITYGSVNYPVLDVPQRPGTHRLLNTHKNVPGVLMKINTELSKVGVNIVAQQLATSSSIGYMIVDMDKDASKDAVTCIKELDENIRTRVLW